jgi:hypothetical protein
LGINLDANHVTKKVEEEYIEHCKPKDKINSFIITKQTMQQFELSVNLIICSEVMDKKEKQYWIDALPILNDKQFNKLEKILLKEKKKIDELPLKYRNQIKELNKQFSIMQQNITDKSRKE